MPTNVDDFLKKSEVTALIGKADTIPISAEKKVAEAFEMARQAAESFLQRTTKLKLSDEVMERALEMWQRQPAMSIEAFFEMADKVKKLKLSDASFKRAMMAWAENPNVPVDKFIKNIPEFSKIRFSEALGKANVTDKQLAEDFGYAAFASLRNGKNFEEMPEVISLIGKKDKLGTNGITIVDSAYKIAKEKAEDIVKKAKSLDLTDAELKSAEAVWRSNPGMSADEFTESLPRYRLAENDKAAGRKPSIPKEVPDQKIPNDPMGPVHNTGPDKSIPAPSSVVDDNTRTLLRSLDDEEIAGTGGIQKIRAVKDKDGTVRVQIEGEILPDPLYRGGKAEPGQKPAPNFNDRESRESLTTLGLNSEGNENWARLHLWGPGFGDEAAAGMFIGPAEFNLKWQNSGIEGHLRNLAREIAPLRPDVHMKVIATAESWGDSTAALAKGEQFFKKVTYEVDISTPTGTRRAKVTFELKTHPNDIKNGTKPMVVEPTAEDISQLYEILPTLKTGVAPS